MSKKKELTFDELTLDELEELSPEEIKELVLRELRYVDEDLSPEEAKRLAVEQLALKEEIMFEQLALKRPADEELGETIVNKLIHNEHSLNELEELTLEELEICSKVVDGKRHGRSFLIGYCDEEDQSKGERPWRKV